MSAVLKPSDHLADLLRQLSPFCGMVEVTMSGESFDQLVETLAALRRISLSMEREIGVHRLGEATRRGREMVEQLATDELKAMVADPAGKIVRPDFGRRARIIPLHPKTGGRDDG